MSLSYASAFLSHSSKHKDLVHAVANELAHRGVLAWLDVNELTPGQDLDQVLRNAGAEQLVMVAFLSEESLNSPWCREELEPRLRSVSNGSEDAIIPVFLEDPLPLVRRWRMLSERWLSPDGLRVNKSYIIASGAAPSVIADKIAQSIYKRAGLARAADVVVAVDQRGNGKRAGAPEDGLIPQNYTRQNWPGLVFRPDLNLRTEHETLYGDNWKLVSSSLLGSLNTALGTLSERRIYITGNMQLAFAWLLGQKFDRSTRTKLTVFNPRNASILALDCSDPRFDTPLPLLTSNEVTWLGFEPDASTKIVSVAIMADHFLERVRNYRAETGDTTPLAVIDAGYIDDGEQVVQLASWLSTAVRQRDVRIYASLPIQAIVLLAALSKHTVGRVSLLEYDRSERPYRECEMPSV